MRARAKLVVGILALVTGCAAPKDTTSSREKPVPSSRVSTQLMFTGKAEEAINLYVSTVPNSRVVSIERYGPGEAGAEGSIKLATISLDGREIRCTDSPPVHEFTFTPSISFWLKASSEAEFAALVESLSKDGKVLMPVGDYGFARKFTFFADRFGVSWQVALE